MPAAPPPVVAVMDEDDLDWDARDWDNLEEDLVKKKVPAPDSVEWGDDDEGFVNKYHAPAGTTTDDWGVHKAPTGDADGDDAGSCSEDEMEAGVRQPRQPVITPCYGGRFITFTLLFSTFRLTAKYTSPITYIGSGAYGTVCSAFDADNSKQVAVKKITDPFADVASAKLVLREVMLLSQLKHSNIVLLVDVVPPPSLDLMTDVYLTTELLHTDLHKLLYEQKAFSEVHIQPYIYQILCGLKYLHSANVVHRDLKPSNLLLTDDGTLKICDFGQARIHRKHMSKRVGTLKYKAPEILLHSSRYTSAVDIWSVGCIFAELLLGSPLFPGIDEHDQLRRILEFTGKPAPHQDLSYLDRVAQVEVKMWTPRQRCSLADMLPKADISAVELVEKMLLFDPNERITVEDAIAHPYLQHLRDPTKEGVFPPLVCDDHEKENMSIDEMKELIYGISLTFNPDYRGLPTTRMPLELLSPLAATKPLRQRKCSCPWVPDRERQWQRQKLED
ncbi:hypothetical protein ACQ4PT_036330 [Festuca glaucescens]